MDRRGFFKSIFLTPFFTPFVLASQPTKKGLSLYLISDSPQVFLSAIFQELQKFGLIYGHNFTLLNSHPNGEELKKTLSQKGWRSVKKGQQADLSLSFRQLGNQTLPSFALIKNESVWDIRSRGLYALWKEMNKHGTPSSLLTVASFKGRYKTPQPGKSADIYIDGLMVEHLSLKKTSIKSYTTKRGNLSVHVENGKAWVSGSTCRHKICLLSPPVASAGERIICAPNHFILEIKGSSFIDTVIG